MKTETFLLCFITEKKISIKI